MHSIPSYSQVFPGIPRYICIIAYSQSSRQAGVFPSILCCLYSYVFFTYNIIFFTFTGGAHSQSFQASCMTVYSYSFMCIHRL